MIFEGSCAIYCLSAVDRGKALLRCPVLGMEKAGLITLSPHEWHSCHSCPTAQSFLQNCAEVLYLLKNMLVWKGLVAYFVALNYYQLFLSQCEKTKKKGSGIRKWKCSFIKAVVKFLFMTHSPPSTMWHMRGEWLPHSLFQIYQFTAAYNTNI